MTDKRIVMKMDEINPLPGASAPANRYENKVDSLKPQSAQTAQKWAKHVSTMSAPVHKEPVEQWKEISDRLHTISVEMEKVQQMIAKVIRDKM